MAHPRDLTDGLAALRAQERAPAPPPSGALLRSVEAVKPVRTRVPLRTLLGVAALACLYPVGAWTFLPLRIDLAMLPRPWLFGVGVLWAVGFIVPLVLAFLPPRGQVLPDGARAGRAALLAASTLFLMALLFTVNAPGYTVMPRSTWAGFFPLWWHCVFFGLKLIVPLVVLGALALRRVALVSLTGLGAAIGAAAGALSGLTLHGLCPYGGAVHVGLAHGGGVIIGALLGALWMPILTGRRVQVRR